MRTFLNLVSMAALAGVVACTAAAQAPAAGPLVLLLPASARTTALGNAWVTGRDESSIFYNPAQLSPTNGIGASFARYGWNGTSAVLTSAVTVGTLTYGWGVEVLEFRAPLGATYPFVPSDAVQAGSRNASSLVAATGASYVIKGFRSGASLKYSEDRADASLADAVPPIRHGLLMGDLGVSHSLWSGTAALTVQNVGVRSNITLPVQTSLGWSRQKQLGEFDLGVFSEVSERNKRVGGGAGLEASLGWIEGWSVTGRAGARRTETAGQRPMSLGAGLAADRLTLDYALEFFEHQRYAHHLSFRWR